MHVAAADAYVIAAVGAENFDYAFIVRDAAAGLIKVADPDLAAFDLARIDLAAAE